MLRAFPDVQAILKAHPHVKYDETTNQQLYSPISADVNAFTVAKFWREFRNLLIHRDGNMSQAFVDTHTVLFEQLRAPYADAMAPLASFRHVQLPDSVFHALSLTHDHFAELLDDSLLQRSRNRRGTTKGISTDSSGKRLLRPDYRAKPLLQQGDHQPSFDFVAQFARTTDPLDDDDL